MKTKIFLLAAILCLAIQTIGQTIPNSGFENWTWIGGWFENPDDWVTNNYQILTPVVKDTIPYRGNYALQVNRTGYAKSQFAFSQHPEDVQVYVKSNIGGSDTVSIEIFVYSVGSIVDSGNWRNITSITSWTLQTIPITQNTTAIDSLEIQVNGGNQIGTFISIDDFTYLSTGIKEKRNEVSWTLYPNPLTNFATLTFENLTNEKHDLVIYSTTGQLVLAITNITNDQVRIEKRDLASGIYFFKLQTDMKVITIGKFSIK